MTGRLWLIRHGPTHSRSFCGWRDIPADLSDHDQIERLETFLPPDAPLVSSDLIRTVTTADRLQGSRPRLPHDPALREIHFGRWEGMDFAAIEAESPGALEDLWQGRRPAPEGESWPDLCARVVPALLGHAARAPEVIVVAHFGTILAALEGIGGLSHAEALARHIDPLSLTRITPGAACPVDLINHEP